MSVSTRPHEIDGVRALAEVDLRHRVAHRARSAEEAVRRDCVFASERKQRGKLALRVVAAEDAAELVVRDGLRRRLRALAESEEVAQLEDALGRSDGLGMVLHRLDWKRPVPERHYLSVVRLGGDLEAVRQRRALDCERVVAHRLEALRHVGEDALPVVPHPARLAVHEALRRDDPAAERLRDGLVSEAHAENRNLPRERLHRRERDARGVGVAGSGRDHEPVRIHRRDSRDVDLVVPHDLRLHAEPLDRLDEVERERVVVVYDECHASSFANLAASKIAFDLFTVSMYSFSGSESATIPAPARIVSVPRSKTIVRITIAKFMSPVLLK